MLFFTTSSWCGDEAVVGFGGDLMLGHRLKALVQRDGMDRPFRGVQALMNEAQAVCLNLEHPVGFLDGRPKFPDKEYHFMMDPRHLPGLTRAGVRVVSLANNHILDHGPEALMDTLEHVDAHGLKRCGAGVNSADARLPALLMVNGRRIAFLAYNDTPPLAFTATNTEPGTAFADPAHIREDVQRALLDADHVVVSFHWGIEYTDRPLEAQRLLAHAAIDAGADAVIGHHPHVPQSMELYKGRPIAYSLGNFVFGTLNPKARVGLFLKVTFRDGLPSTEIVPLNVDNAKTGYETRPLTGRNARTALKRLTTLSAAYGTKLRLRGDRAYLP